MGFVGVGRARALTRGILSHRCARTVVANGDVDGDGDDYHYEQKLNMLSLSLFGRFEILPPPPSPSPHICPITSMNQ